MIKKVCVLNIKFLIINKKELGNTKRELLKAVKAQTLYIYIDEKCVNVSITFLCIH